MGQGGGSSPTCSTQPLVKMFFNRLFAHLSCEDYHLSRCEVFTYHAPNDLDSADPSSMHDGWSISTQLNDLALYEFS